ncbi:MAG: ribosome maturation factor RimP [Proteobacteria bacterium]|nr:ribosome maturation factor RimP [Pseudomonadota bacterium]
MPATELELQIESLVRPPLDAMGFTLVRVRFLDGKSPRTLQIMAERTKDGSMSMEDCVTVNNAISTLLDVEDPIQGEYNLEISSPGMDRPLVRPVDFEKYTGYKIKLTATETIDGRKRFKGKLTGFKDDTIYIELTEEKIEAQVPYSKLDHANIIITDEMLKAQLKQKKQHAN